MNQRAFLEDFKDFQSELHGLAIALPEVTSRLNEIISKSSTLNTRAKSLKDTQGYTKLDRHLVEQFL